MKNSFITSNKYLNIRDLILLTALFVVVMFATFYSVNLLFDSFFEGVIRSEEQLSGLKISFSYIISAAITLFLTFLYRIFRASKDNKGVINLLFGGKVSALRLLWGGVLIFSAQIVTNPLVEHTGESLENYYYMLNCIDAAGMWGGISVILIAPIFEEFFFRGVILRDIADNHGYFLAIIISSLLFSVIHFNLAQMIPALLSAFVLGYIYILTKSIWMVISLHLLNNGVSYLLFNLLPKDEYTKPIEQMFTTQSIYYIVYATAAIFLTIMFARLILLCMKNNKTRASEVLLNEQSNQQNNSSIEMGETAEIISSEEATTPQSGATEQNEQANSTQI